MIYQDDSHLREHLYNILNYMDEVREEVIETLTPLQFAAITNDVQLFEIEYNKQRYCI